MNRIACTSLRSIPSADSGSSTTGRSGAFTWASAAGLGRDVIESLEHGACLDGCLQNCRRLPDATVTGVLKGARALLPSSLAEGYGLPLAEALTCGAPVLCSGIPVFREVGGGSLEHVDPTDAAAWRQAVLNYVLQHSPQRWAHLRRLGCWSRSTWEQHFAVVDTALSKEKGGP